MGSLYSRGILFDLRNAYQEHCVGNKPFNLTYMYTHFVLLVWTITDAGIGSSNGNANSSLFRQH